MSLNNNFISGKQCHNFPGKVDGFDCVLLSSRTIHSTFQPLFRAAAHPLLQEMLEPPLAGSRCCLLPPLTPWMAFTTAWIPSPEAISISCPI